MKWGKMCGETVTDLDRVKEACTPFLKLKMVEIA
jgi:hypothetical protein